MKGVQKVRRVEIVVHLSRRSSPDRSSTDTISTVERGRNKRVGIVVHLSRRSSPDRSSTDIISTVERGRNKRIEIVMHPPQIDHPHMYNLDRNLPIRCAA